MNIKQLLLVVVSMILMIQVPVFADPSVFTFPYENLAQAKAKYDHGNSDIKEIVAVMLKEADKALKQPARSVMDKSDVSVSGDKHDYYSVAPYWWPNPDTPDGLPYINKDGVWNYKERAKTDADAFNQTCGNMQKLGLAYYFTGNEIYANKATELVRVWFLDKATKMNPNLNYGQAIKGIRAGSPGGGVLEGLGFTKVLDGIALIDDSDAWSEENQANLKSWFTQYNTWLHETEFGKAAANPTNNIGTWYHVQAVYLYLYLGETEKAKNLAKAGFDKLLDIQFSQDGAQPQEARRTKSFAYYNYNLSAWTQLAIVATQAGFDGWNYTTKNGRSLRLGLAFMAQYADPDKPWIKEDIVEPNRQSPMSYFALAAQFCNDPEIFQEALKYRDTQAKPRWLLWSKMDGDNSVMIEIKK